MIFWCVAPLPHALEVRELFLHVYLAAAPACIAAAGHLLIHLMHPEVCAWCGTHPGVRAARVREACEMHISRAQAA